MIKFFIGNHAVLTVTLKLSSPIFDNFFQRGRRYLQIYLHKFNDTFMLKRTVSREKRPSAPSTYKIVENIFPWN